VDMSGFNLVTQLSKEILISTSFLSKPAEATRKPLPDATT
jgi:hypothetical protein